MAEGFATTSSEAQKAAFKRTANHLDEGIKAITKRQKHVKVANRFNYGWATVQAYDIDDLVSSSDDEKRLEKAEKEAERRAAKKRRAGDGNSDSKRKTGNWSDGLGPSNKKDNPVNMMQPSRPPATPVIPKPRVIGPCYRCAGWGHLAASCTKAKATYPLNQPVVDLADPLANIDACVLNVDSSTVACSAEESGKSKGVDSTWSKVLM